jgi:hypothetical protein
MTTKGLNTVSFVPCTPGGSLLVNLASKTMQGAWDNLLKDASHMPYDGVQGFRERGYTIEKLKGISSGMQ